MLLNATFNRKSTISENDFSGFAIDVTILYSLLPKDIVPDPIDPPIQEVISEHQP